LKLFELFVNQVQTVDVRQEGLDGRIHNVVR